MLKTHEREAWEVRTCSERVDDGHISQFAYSVNNHPQPTAYCLANGVVYSVFGCTGLKYKTNKYPPSIPTE